MVISVDLLGYFGDIELNTSVILFEKVNQVLYIYFWYVAMLITMGLVLQDFVIVGLVCSENGKVCIVSHKVVYKKKI